MAAPSFYPEGSLVLPSDDELRTLHKLAVLNGGSSGSGSGGGSGSGDVQVYSNRDPAAPDNPALAAVSYNTSTQVATWWPAGGSAWE